MISWSIYYSQEYRLEVMSSCIYSTVSLQFELFLDQLWSKDKIRFPFFIANLSLSVLTGYCNTNNMNLMCHLETHKFFNYQEQKLIYFLFLLVNYLKCNILMTNSANQQKISEKQFINLSHQDSSSIRLRNNLHTGFIA